MAPHLIAISSTLMTSMSPGMPKWKPHLSDGNGGRNQRATACSYCCHHIIICAAEANQPITWRQGCSHPTRTQCMGWVALRMCAFLIENFISKCCRSSIVYACHLRIIVNDLQNLRRLIRVPQVSNYKV